MIRAVDMDVKLEVGWHCYDNLRIKVFFIVGLTVDTNKFLLLHLVVLRDCLKYVAIYSPSINSCISHRTLRYDSLMTCTEVVLYCLVI